MPVFDQYQNSAFDRVTKVMGQTAVWHKNSGDIEGAVLYRDPNKIYRIKGVEYMPERPEVEYREGVFDGMYEAVQTLSEVQTMTVDGTTRVIREILREWDGKSFIAKLEDEEIE